MDEIVETAVATKNAMLNIGGFSPDQWVLGKQLRPVGPLTAEDEHGRLGVHEELLDPRTEFAHREELRLHAQRAFVEVDCS